MGVKLTIELINVKWHVNGNSFSDMSETERAVLAKFIFEYNKELELKENKGEDEFDTLAR